MRVFWESNLPEHVKTAIEADDYLWEMVHEGAVDFYINLPKIGWSAVVTSESGDRIYVVRPISDLFTPEEALAEYLSSD